MVWAAVAIAFAVLLVVLGPILTPFITAIILAYMLEPGVSWLQRRRLPRPLGAIAMILLTIVVTLGILLVLVPILQQEISVIREKLPGLIERLTSTTLPWISAKTGFDIPLDAAALRERIGAVFSGSGDDVATALLAYARSGWGAAIQIVGLVILVPVLLLYLLIDWHAMLRRLDELLPRRWRPSAHDIAGELDQLLGQYLRGQARVVIALVAFYSIGLLIAGFKLWLPIGVLSGILVVIPYFGFTIGMVFALVDGLLQFEPWRALVAVGVVYGLGQALESYYLTPFLVGERIGLHPVIVIFALLAFGSLFGFVGVLLALPLAAIAAVALGRLRRAYLASDFYRLPPQ
jgi:predicted PurR-regulated permease PerM